MSGFIQRIEQLLEHRPQDVERAAAMLDAPELPAPASGRRGTQSEAEF